MKWQKRASLLLEQLEERRVPATIHFSKGELFISNPTVNAGATSLTIFQVAPNSFTVRDGASFDGTFTGVNFIDYTGTNIEDVVIFDLARFKFSGSALFKTGNGDDRLDVRAAGGSLGGILTALTGLGSDTVDLNFNGTGALTIGRSVIVSDADGIYTLQSRYGNAVPSLTRFGTVMSDAHDPSRPDRNSNGEGPEVSGCPPPVPSEKSSSSAGGNAVAAPSGVSEPVVKGSPSFISASLAVDREAPGPGPEARAGGVPAPITHATRRSCSASGLSADYQSGAARAVDFRHVSESVRLDRQAFDALPTAGSTMGPGLRSRGGQTTAGILADTIWLQVPAGILALEMGAVTTRLGGDALAGSAANSGSESLETASEVTLGFVLAGSLIMDIGSQAERPTLLLVESDEDNRYTMTAMLFEEGYHVVAVATGRDAWNVLRSPFAPIDMMLLNVHLPDISGLHLVQRLRQNYPTLPVFAWMYGSEPAEVAQLGELGVYHYTPGQAAEVAELLESVRAFLRGTSHPLE